MSSAACLTGRSLPKAIQGLRRPTCTRCLTTGGELTIARRVNPLAKILRDSIKATGPLSFARYMQFCLTHPTEGYYSKSEVFGNKGDFITSPEISQIFGELLAIWFLMRYMAAGSPTRCRLVELGPGRGTLMDDIVRTLSTFPSIATSLKSVHLIENSEKMKGLQHDKLGKRCKDSDIELHWEDRLDDLEASEDYTLLVAHEFFDAMPIYVIDKTQDGWREVLIGLDPTYDPNLSKSVSGLQPVVSREPTTMSTLLSSSSKRFASLPQGSRIEVSQDSWRNMRRVGEVLAGKSGGAGLVVDYGGDHFFGQSFRAFRDHKIVDPFETPGTADLTANVDFAYLKESLDRTGTQSLGLIPQSNFLLSLGLQPRLEKLVSSAPTARQSDIRKAAQRLVDPLGMGHQYQVMGLVSPLSSEEVYPFVFNAPSGAVATPPLSNTSMPLTASPDTSNSLSTASSTTSASSNKT